MRKFWRERNHPTQNYGLANLVLWTTKNRTNIAPSLQGYNSVLCGWFIFKIYMKIPKLTYFEILLKVFARNVSFGGCLRKYWQAFIVYMFRRPPEVLNLGSDNALISGFGKVPMDYSFYSFYWLDSLEIRLDHNSTYYRSLSKNSDVKPRISHCDSQNLQYKTHPEFWPHRRIFKTSLYYKTRLILETRR